MKKKTGIKSTRSNIFIFRLINVNNIEISNLIYYNIINLYKLYNCFSEVFFLADNHGNPTQVFSIKDELDMQAKKVLTEVYYALQKKGYTAVDQIVGYLLSEDPTYITNFNNARAEIRKLDRDELLKLMVQNYLNLK